MKKILLIRLTVAMLLLTSIFASAQTPDFGAASSFALFTSAGAFNNAGASVVTGDIGTNVGAFNGFPPGIVIGAIHVADPVTAQAAPAVDMAYSYLVGLICGQVIGTNLGNNQVLGPNTYCLGGASTLNGTLTLDGQNNPNAVFVFQIDGALSTGILSQIVLINSASICNVYFQVNGMVSLGDFSVFRGHIVANGAISLLSNASLFGRALSRAGAISLANNIVTLTGAPSPVIITASGSTTFCQGGSVILSGNMGGVWSTGETTPSITVTTSGDYFVTTTNSCGTVISNHITVIVVPDNLPPVFTSCPANLILSCTSPIPTPVTPVATDNCDISVSISFTQTSTKTSNGSCSDNSYVIIRSWVAADDGNRTAVCVQTITVQDLNPPIIVICPAPITVSCPNLIPPPNLLSVVATDNCSGNPVISLFSEVITNQTCVNAFILVRTYRATDACGNFTACIQNITVSNATLPTIICPPNLQVSCFNQVPAPNINSVIATGNCGSTVSVSFISDVNSNQSCINRLIVTRTYMATDPCGNTASCNQIITVYDNTPPVLPIQNNITIECDQELPKVPVLTPIENCTDISTITFIETSDQSKWLQLCAHYTYTVKRLWIATDACGNSATLLQIINVEDKTPPILTNLPDTAVYVSCDEGAVHGEPIGIDNCDLTPSILFDFKYLYLKGCVNSYKVVRTWTVGDRCGNISIATQNIYVVDNDIPELTCPPNIIKISTIPIIVNWMMPKAWDDCDGMLASIQTKGPPNGSLFNPGTTTIIEFQTTDYCGNVNICSFTIIINTGVIVNKGPILYGTVKNIFGELIDKTEVNIIGSINQYQMSNGNYEFPGIPAGSNEEISIIKSENPLNGVSTLDLIHITDHLLGKKALNTPYKLLAADVNNSGNITTGDLVELRRLLLHITDKFQNVDSWRFLPIETIFSNTSNPWNNPVSWTSNIFNIQNNVVADFYGIKMGDVTQDSKANAVSKLEVKGNESYTLFSENRNYLKGDFVQILIKGADLQKLQGLQFTLDFDIKSLQFINYKSKQHEITDKNFGLRYLEAGKITSSIVFDNDIVNDELLSFNFIALENGSLSKTVSMNSDLLASEAYINDEVLELSLSFSNDELAISNSEIILYQNEPNPFENTTLIRFTIAEDQEMSFSVFNLEGKLIKEVNALYSKGDNSIVLTKSDFPSAGIYYYQLKNREKVEVKKMIYMW